MKRKIVGISVYAGGAILMWLGLVCVFVSGLI